jgi:hypothetical protein
MSLAASGAGVQADDCLPVVAPGVIDAGGIDHEHTSGKAGMIVNFQLLRALAPEGTH